MSAGLYSGTSGLALGVGLYKGTQGLWSGASGFTTGSGAALSLNFLAGAPLDPRVTFTRASTATFVDSKGVLQTAAVDVPRFDYDPANLTAKGLLIEEQRTNLLTYSDQFDQATWTKSGATISPNITVSPDGTSNADKLVEDSTTGQHRFFRAATGTTNTNSYTVSFFAKAAERTRIYVGVAEGATFVRQGNAVFDLSAGTIVNASSGTGGASGGSATIQAFPNGWYRCTYTLTLGGTDTSIFTDVNLVSTGTTISYAGNGVSGAFVYGAQLEAGAFATSYIPTVASTVTRASDVAVMTGTNFSSWYNQTDGTFVSSFTSRANAVVLVANDGTFNNRLPQLSIGATSAYENYIVSGGSVVATLIPAGTQVFGTPANVAVTYALNDYAAAANGGTVVTDTSGALPTGVNSLYIGRFQNGTTQVNGYIRSITYYPTRLANAQLQALTA